MGKKLLHWAAALAVPALLLDPGRAARESYPVWVDGVQVTSANEGNVLRDAGVPTVRYAPLSNTLVLDGASISWQAGQNAGIYAGKGLRIALLGNSSIANDQVSGRGIFAHGDLEICGTGSLKVDSQGEGIFVCAGGLRVRDSYVGVSSRSGVALCAVAYVDIQGGRVTARARSSQMYQHGIYVPEGDVSLCQGQARACTASVSGGYGIYAPKGALILRDSSVRACAGAHRPSTFVSVFGICAGGLEVSGSRVTAAARGGYANGLYADTVRIRSSCITAIAKGANGQGIYAGKLSIQDSQVRATAEGCYGKGISADEVTISGGTVSATALGTGGGGHPGQVGVHHQRHGPGTGGRRLRKWDLYLERPGNLGRGHGDRPGRLRRLWCGRL